MILRKSHESLVEITVMFTLVGQDCHESSTFSVHDLRFETDNIVQMSLFHGHSSRVLAATSASCETCEGLKTHTLATIYISYL